MAELKNTLLSFRNYTTSLINCLESDNYDALEDLLNKRQALIDELEKSQYDKHLFKEICEEYEIVKLNSKMNSIFTEKMNSLKSEIKKISFQRNVNNNYNAETSVDSIFFNKKI